MNILSTAHYEDYGHEWYLQLLSNYPTFALLDTRVQWDEYPDPELFPMLLVSIGSRSLCGFTFRWKWFEIHTDFITTAPRNLEYYRGKDD